MRFENETKLIIQAYNEGKDNFPSITIFQVSHLGLFGIIPRKCLLPSKLPQNLKL